MRKPSASIIINNHNLGCFLDDAIRSALGQSEPGVETIVVDDGSTDHSREIIARYADRTIPVLKDNDGQASAFNAGFRQATGDVIIFLDADDLLSPEAVKAALELFDSTDVVKVQWPLREITQTGEPTGRRVPQQPLSEGCLRDLVIARGPFNTHITSPTSGNAWSRRFLEAVVPVRECGDKHGADAYLFIQAPLYGRIRRAEVPLGSYRLHPAQFSGQTAESRIRRDLRRYDSYCDWFSAALTRLGLPFDPVKWRAPGSHYHWLRAWEQAIEQIRSFIPDAESFILIDDGQWCLQEIFGERCLPLVQSAGAAAEAALDDAQAIAALEASRGRGVRHLVLGLPSFWWREVYRRFWAHVEERYRCVLRAEALLGFDLQAAPIPQPLPAIA